MTTWCPVPGFEDRYEIDREGRIWSLRSSRLLTPYVAANGYLRVDLWDGNRKHGRLIHRLLAEVFVAPQPTSKHEVCHVDGDPLNNALSNLRWGTHGENMNDAVKHGTHPQSRKTHCKRGHEFTPENTSVARGRRICRACRAARRWS